MKWGILQKLTGGILLSRNKDFLVFYRGKNFLSPDVAEALLEKERLAKTLQDEEEQARLRASALVTSSMVIADESGTAGTLGETLDANARWGKILDDNHEKELMREAEILRHANLVRKLQRKLEIVSFKPASRMHELDYHTLASIMCLLRISHPYFMKQRLLCIIQFG